MKSKIITFYASRNPEGPYSKDISLSNFKPKRSDRNPVWMYWPPDFNKSFHCILTERETKNLGLYDLKPGICRNLNTGKEFTFERAESV